MAFYEIQFPSKISLQSQGGPRYQTDVVVVSSGMEQRNVTWAQARRRYDVAHAARLPAASDAVKAFFHNMLGKAHGFRFKDWTDYSATIAEGKFTAISGTTFQMTKRYTSGGQTYDRVISKPVSGTVSVTGGAGVSISYTTGIVSVSSGTPTTWSGEFDVPCRFDTDALSVDVMDKNGSGELITGWHEIPIVEIRV